MDNFDNILNYVFYTDKTWFLLVGYVHVKNSSLLSAKKSHAIHEILIHNQNIGGEDCNIQEKNSWLNILHKNYKFRSLLWNQSPVHAKCNLHQWHSFRLQDLQRVIRDFTKNIINNMNDLWDSPRTTCEILQEQEETCTDMIIESISNKKVRVSQCYVLSYLCMTGVYLLFECTVLFLHTYKIHILLIHKLNHTHIHTYLHILLT